MTALEWIAYGLAGWFGLSFVTVGTFAATRYRASARVHAAMLRRLDSHPREAVRNPEDAWRRIGGA